MKALVVTRKLIRLERGRRVLMSICDLVIMAPNRKSNLHYRPTTVILPMLERVTSGGANHLRGLTPGKHSSEETSQRWRADANTVSDLTSPRIERKPPALIAMYLTIELTGRCGFELLNLLHFCSMPSCFSPFLFLISVEVF